MTNKVSLSLAISEYDHIRDLIAGDVSADGIDLVPLTMPVEEIFYRFLEYREWDVTELSFAKYCALKSSGDADFTAIPVFPSRMFRMSSVFVRADSAMTSPSELAGKRIGLPEWAQTAAVYTRGWLQETLGVDLAGIEWVQAGVNQAGRREKVSLSLPDGVTVRSEPERSLSDLLLKGEIDAVFSAHPPAAFERNDGTMRQLVDDWQVERDYYRSTGIYPIMHVIAIRDAVLERHPWVARNLFKAFEEARDRSLSRIFELTASRIPLPWAAVHARSALAEFGSLFPYGIASNRTTLEAFLQFCGAQGVTSRTLSIDELFPKSFGGEYRI